MQRPSTEEESLDDKKGFEPQAQILDDLGGMCPNSNLTTGVVNKLSMLFSGDHGVWCGVVWCGVGMSSWDVALKMTLMMRV